MPKQLEKNIVINVDIDAFIELQECLNDLLAIWVAQYGYDFNIVDKSVKALAKCDSKLPVTLAFADRVKKLRNKKTI